MDTQSNVEVCDRNIETLLMHLVRCGDVFQAARQHLLPEHFGQTGETHYRHTWKSILEYYDEHGERPNGSSLIVRVLNGLQNDPGTIPAMHEIADEMVKWMYDETETPDSQLDAKEALKILRELLIDRAAGHQLRMATANARGGAIPNLPRLLATAQEAVDEYAALGNDQRVSYSSVPKGMQYASAMAPARPTGVMFMDRFLGGGSQMGDVNVLIGPTGVGKTLLSTHMAVSMAELQHQIERRGGGKPGIVVFVSYETGMVEWQKRAAACAARVNLNRLKFLTDNAQLTTTGNLEPYEQQMYARKQEQGILLGEQERLAEVGPWMDTYLKFIDFSPAETGYGGNGHVPEIRQHLSAIQRECKLPIYAVIIDWAGAMIQNYTIANNGKFDGGPISMELSTLVGRVHKEVTGPFGCTAWIAHQLKGALGKRSPTTVPHHSEAAWCAGFAERAWYAFCLGSKDEEHNICQLAVTKTRTGEALPPIICKIDGAFGKLRDASSQFTGDKIGGRLAPTGDVERVHASIPTEGTGNGGVAVDLEIT
jgi:hypothetical protein